MNCDVTSKKSTSKEPHRPCLSAQMANYTTEGAESAIVGHLRGK